MKRKVSTKEIRRAERLRLIKDLVESGSYSSSSNDVAKALVKTIDDVDTSLRVVS